MATTKKKRRRRTTAVSRRKTRKKKSDNLTNFFVPLVLMLGIVGCLALLGFMGLKTVSASSFFEVEDIEISGNQRISDKRIETIVKTATLSGVWETDLDRVRNDLERISYIRHASVSRVLPSTIRVRVEERRAVAIARIDSELKELDADGTILGDAPATAKRRHLMTLIGWDEALDEKANKDNLERLNIYRQLNSDWKQNGLDKRVVAVDLESTRNVEAYVIDSGERVILSLGNEDFVSRLKEGLKHVAGHGKRVSKVELNNTSPVIVYRD